MATSEARFTCADCGKTFRGTPSLSPTGRSLCPGCADSALGLAAGVLSTGGGVGGSISAAGWFQRVRRARSRPPR